MGDESCQRCGESFQGAPAILSIEREGIPLDGSPLTLCPHCVRSYDRWLRKRHKHFPASRVEDADEGTERTTRPRSRHRSHSRKTRAILISVGFILAAIIGSALLMTVIIRTVERSNVAAEGGP